MASKAKQALELLSQINTKELNAPMKKQQPVPQQQQQFVPRQYERLEGSGQQAMSEMMEKYSNGSLSDEEVDLIQERASKLLPAFDNAFISEMLATPVINPMDIQENGVKDAFADRLMSSNGNGNNTLDIMHRLDEMDGKRATSTPYVQESDDDDFALPSDMRPKFATARQPQPINESVSRPQQSGSVDYNYIKYIVESAVDSRMKQLNESKGAGSGITGVFMINESTFHIVDNDDNVFECTMRFKGKKKGSKKK